MVLYLVIVRYYIQLPCVLYVYGSVSLVPCETTTAYSFCYITYCYSSCWPTRTVSSYFMLLYPTTIFCFCIRMISVFYCMTLLLYTATSRYCLMLQAAAFSYSQLSHAALFFAIVVTTRLHSSCWCNTTVTCYCYYATTAASAVIATTLLLLLLLHL